jgi:capsular exopolysaccharide synthesis family protein
MSRFFQALEQAERERALRTDAPPTAPRVVEAAQAPVAPPPPPSRADAAPTEAVRRPAAAAVVERPGPEGREVGIDEHLVSLLAPASFEAEQYRVLRHLVEHLHRSAGLRVTGISSPGVGDGKTTTAINLAGALAQGHEARVLLVDADMRRPSVLRYLGTDTNGRLGLADAILRSDVTLADVVTRYEEFNVDVVHAGARPAVPYELLKSRRLGEILETARQQYEYVIVDTSPLVGLPDCKVLGKWIDGFVVVVNAHRTQRKAVGEALTVLDPSKIVGLVFNGDERRMTGQYYPYDVNAGGAGRRRRGWGRAVNRVRGALRDRFALGRRGRAGGV